jgi:putative membrane protein
VDPHLAGFLAAGVGLDQLAPDFATPVIRELLALLLCLFAGGLAIYGYLRWLRNEKAMRLKRTCRTPIAC